MDKKPIAKPRFIPIKKKTISEEVKAVEQDTDATANATDRLTVRNSNLRVSEDKFRNYHDTLNNSNTTGRGRGRGRWVTPAGAAFFTSNISNTVAPKASSSSSLRQSGQHPSQSAVSVSSVSGNVDVLEDKSSSLPIVIKAEPHLLPGSTSPSSSFRVLSHNDNDDNDSESSDDANDGIRTDAKNSLDISRRLHNDDAAEVWPPPGKFNPSLPLSLPLGPRTVAARTQLSLLPILADPSDEAALMHEEHTTTFLLQMPSELRLKPVRKAAPGDTETDDVAKESFGAEDVTGLLNGAANIKEKAQGHQFLPTGPVGKLQMMKSGRVYLVTDLDIEHGQRKIYEVVGGMDVAFAQFVASITTSNPAPAAPAHIPTNDLTSPIAEPYMAATTNGSAPRPHSLTAGPFIKSETAYISNSISNNHSTSSSSSSNSKGINRRELNSIGQFHLLADITRKLVVTPTHLIGQEKPTSKPTSNPVAISSSSSFPIIQGVDSSYSFSMGMTFSQGTVVGPTLGSGAGGNGVGASSWVANLNLNDTSSNYHSQDYGETNHDPVENFMGVNGSSSSSSRPITSAMKKSTPISGAGLSGGVPAKVSSESVLTFSIKPKGVRAGAKGSTVSSMSSHSKHGSNKITKTVTIKEDANQTDSRGRTWAGSESL